MVRAHKPAVFEATFGTWAVSAKGTEQLLANQLGTEHGSQQIFSPVGSHSIVTLW
jgi:hypothetical protein